MAIIGVVLDRGIVFDRGSDREVVRIQWVERYDIASVKCVVPGVNRRRRSQGSELIADRANRERRTDSHEQWYAKRAAVGAQDAVSNDGAQRVAHDDRGLLGQFTGNDLVDFVPHSGAGGVQEDVASEYLERLLIHARAVPVDRAQDGLHPFPVQWTSRSRVGAILGVDLGIRDSGALPHGLGELRLKN